MDFARGLQKIADRDARNLRQAARSSPSPGDDSWRASLTDLAAIAAVACCGCSSRPADAAAPEYLNTCKDVLDLSRELLRDLPRMYQLKAAYMLKPNHDW